MAIKQKAFDTDHPVLATSLNNLALLYSSQARYADTEPLYKRSLAIREKALGPDHPDVVHLKIDLRPFISLLTNHGRKPIVPESL